MKNFKSLIDVRRRAAEQSRSRLRNQEVSFIFRREPMPKGKSTKTSRAIWCIAVSCLISVLFVSTVSALTITSTVLPNGEVGVPYNFELQISGGTPPYNIDVTKGSLPPGLDLVSSAISGIPERAKAGEDGEREHEVRRAAESDIGPERLCVAKNLERSRGGIAIGTESNSFDGGGPQIGPRGKHHRHLVSAGGELPGDGLDEGRRRIAFELGKRGRDGEDSHGGETRLYTARFRYPHVLFFPLRTPMHSLMTQGSA